MSEQVVRRIVARSAKVSPQDVVLEKGLVEQGVDSLGMLVVRESLERELRVHIPDAEWVRFRSLADIAAYAARAASSTPPAAGAGIAGAPPAGQPARGLGTDGRFREEIEIGMPLTGRNNLAEGPLLQQVGHVRWQHMSAVCGVPSREITDDEGSRLYATFFFVDVAFPAERPMAAFAENERLRLVTSIRRFGESMLDGTTIIVPAELPEPAQRVAESVESALAAGYPAIRMSNIFVRQFAGAGWLKKSRPVNPGFARIPETAAPPDSLVAVKQAEKDGGFPLSGRTLVSLLPRARRVEYGLVPDRDLNGAGLVYFAHYPVFADIAEREVLRGADLPMPEELIDRRTVVRRRSAYLNNAAAQDRLAIDVLPYVDIDGTTDSGGVLPARIVTQVRISRLSDGRTMYVATAEKLIVGRLIEDWPGAEQFLDGALAG